jgi:SAM-dependent methyltransferase
VDEASAYREQSRTSWQSAAGAWERERAAVSRAAVNVTPWLIEHAALQAGQTVLELACGTGETGMRAAAIVGSGGRVIETDQAPAMVEAALRRAAELGLDNVEARVMDAEHLELPDGSVDAVVCRWGLMLMADPAVCVAEVLRVLRPGGRLAANVWGPPEDNPWPAVVLGVLIDEGLMQPSGPDSGPGLFALADETRLRDLVTGAGLTDVVVERIVANWQYADGDEYWRVQTSLSTSAARTLAPLDDGRIAGIRRQVDGELDAYRTADGLVLPGLSLGVAAHRPL